MYISLVSVALVLCRLIQPAKGLRDTPLVSEVVNMETKIPISIEGGPCLCGNNDPLEFRHYRDSNGVHIGKSCKICHQEWLDKEHLIRSPRTDQDVTVMDTSMTSGYGAKVAGEIMTAKFVEEIVNGSNGVGAGVVIVLESGFVIWDVSLAYADRKDGIRSRKVFVDDSVKRIIESLFSAGFIILGSIGPEIIGTVVDNPLSQRNILICGIIGGIISGVLGKVIGSALGSVAGKAIAPCFRDDRAITRIEDLMPADHVVFTGWLLHPRCHAIVVEHNGKDEIKVIRNTYGKGVVEEWMPFSQPLYRVEYGEDECCDPNTVIRNATSKIGKQLYSLASYNCKTFARECKTIDDKTKST